MQIVHPVIARRLRRKFGGGVPSGAPPIPGPPLDLGNTLYVQMGFRAVINVYGRDGNETVRDIESTTFASSDTSVFNVRYDSDADYGYVIPVSVGTGTLTIKSDAAAANEQEPVVPITDTITVITYRVATRLVFYYTEAGSTDELLVPVLAGTTILQLPTNTTCTIRVEGQDDDGNVVPLSNVVFGVSGAGISIAATADPNAVTVTPLTNDISSVDVTADGDPSPATASLFAQCLIGTHLFLRATHLTETYSIEPIE